MGLALWPRSFGEVWCGRARQPVHAFNRLKILAFLACLGSSACARGVPTAEAPEMELSQLREENARLEREIATLREASRTHLSSDPDNCGDARATPSEVPREESEPDTTEEASREPAATTGHPDLPVVKLSPEGLAKEGIAISDASAWEETEPPSGTRPVLKVTGGHEARVYHRPLNRDELEGATSRTPAAAAKTTLPDGGPATDLPD